MAPFGTVEYTSSKRINVWTNYPLKERQEFYQIPATIQPAVPLTQRDQQNGKSSNKLQASPQNSREHAPPTGFRRSCSNRLRDSSSACCAFLVSSSALATSSCALASVRAMTSCALLASSCALDSALATSSCALLASSCALLASSCALLA